MTHALAIAAAAALSMPATPAFARGGDHPSGIPDKPTSERKAKPKPAATVKPTPTNRPTIASPTLRGSGSS